MWYFAFGSNMNQARMKERNIPFIYRMRGTLEGWTLTFNKKANTIAGCGYATIEPAAEAVVEGILYLIPENGIRRLDLYEGMPRHYRRFVMEVAAPHRKIEAHVYIANPRMIQRGLLPTAAYLEHLKKGKPFLSKGYQKFLETIETL